MSILHRLFFVVLAWCAVTSSSRADIILRVEDTNLIANTPNQVVRILGTYDGTPPPLDGVSLSVLIGLGGPDPMLGPLPGLPGNIDGPNITSINLKPIGGELSSFSSAQIIGSPRDQLIQASLLRADADSPRSAAFTGQLVGLLTVDTTGITSGQYRVDLQNATLGITSSYLGGAGGTVATSLSFGTVNVVPEPTSLAMIVAVGGLGMFRRRRVLRSVTW